MGTNEIVNADCLDYLKTCSENSVDLIVTDPPYGYSFMGKDWDKAVPSIDIWKECLRVLKPGAFCFVMSAPRQDVLSQMIVRLTEAGFKTDFTSLYWTYASGFPKAMNISKAVDKKLGKFRVRVDIGNRASEQWRVKEGREDRLSTLPDSNPISDEAKALDGSYGGFQPKPAVEVILVCMKPLSEKTYVDQALANGKGVTWLDDCRIPTDDLAKAKTQPIITGSNNFANRKGAERREYVSSGDGRFPANLLVSDDVLNDGTVTKSTSSKRGANKNGNIYGKYGLNDTLRGVDDSGGFSRFFSLDAWAAKIPFLQVAKASKSEKNNGLDEFEQHEVNDGREKTADNAFQRGATKRVNTHPTVKSLRLMSYLITLGSRQGDTVLDPFCGSGTTCVAAKQLGRTYIGIELSEEYAKIAEARIAAVLPTLL
jgi:DNA modification methylase